MKIRKNLFLFCLPALAVMLTNCNDKQNQFAPPPPPQVEVVAPIVKDTSVFVEYPATTATSMTVEIRARVQGLLKSRDFESGQYVTKGQLLFTIEPAEYEAAVATANGNLTQAEVDLEQKKTTYQRKKQAYDRSKAVPEIDVLQADADVKSAVAVIGVQKAALADATRNLSYTKIVSPLAGRISKSQVDQGSLVGAGESTLLTTVIQDDPLYVNFEINERDILPFLDHRPAKGEKLKIEDKELRLTLSDGSIYPKKGRFNFIDNMINSETGTIDARAGFENADGKLAAGLFVRLGIPQEFKKAVLVPQMAIQRDLGGSYVLVVGEGDKVVRRNVMPTKFTEGELKIIEPLNEKNNKGVKASDKVIVSNLQRIRAGAKVTIKGAKPKKQAAAKPAEKPAK